MGQPGNNGYINSRSLVCHETKRPFEQLVMLVPSAITQNRLSCQDSYEPAASYVNREEFGDPDLLERSMPSPHNQYDPHFVSPHDISLSSMVFDLKNLIAAHSISSNNFTQSTPYSAMLDTLDSLTSSSSSYLAPQGSSQSFYSSADLEDRVPTIGHAKGFDIQLGLPMSDLPGTQPNSCHFGERITLTRESLHDLPAVDPRSGSTCTIDSCASGLSNSVQSSLVVESLVSEMPGNSRDSSASPSKPDLTVQSPENSDTDHKHQGTKRRKVQQKRVVCVPLAGDGKQKIEAPPSDDWAWRKYGQKPIKGSPYPRGYYRCSSSKGCSARKQVERSRSDPTMLLITYTSDHNHSWPVQRNSSVGVANRPEPSLEIDSNHKHETADCEPAENLFSSIINSPDTRNEHVMSSLESIHMDQESFTLDKDADLCIVRPHTEEEDFFDELGELPELAAIFKKGFLEEKSCQEMVGTSMDSYSILGWSSNPFLESKVVC